MDEIDIEILPLVEALNKAGYVTDASCQGGGTYGHFKNAYIAFHDVDVSRSDLPKIRNIVRSFTYTPFRVYTGYYDGYGVDPDAGMYSVIFRGRYTPIR